MSANTVLAVRDHAGDEIAELRADLDGHLKEAAKLSQRIATIEAMRTLVQYAAPEERGVTVESAKTNQPERRHDP